MRPVRTVAARTLSRPCKACAPACAPACDALRHDTHMHAHAHATCNMRSPCLCAEGAAAQSTAKECQGGTCLSPCSSSWGVERPTPPSPPSSAASKRHSTSSRRTGSALKPTCPPHTSHHAPHTAPCTLSGLSHLFPGACRLTNSLQSGWSKRATAAGLYLLVQWKRPS